MKNLDFLSLMFFFFALTFLKKMLQSINGFINLFMSIINSNVISEEFLDSLNLIEIQTSGIHKLSEIITIDEDKNFQFLNF